MGLSSSAPKEPKRKVGMRHRRRAATYPEEEYLPNLRVPKEEKKDVEEADEGSAKWMKKELARVRQSVSLAAAASADVVDRFLWRSSSVGHIVAGVRCDTGEWLLRRTLRKGKGSALQERDLSKFRSATVLARKLAAEKHPNIAPIVQTSETESTISVTFLLGGEPIDLFFPSRRSSFFTMKERMAACVTSQLLNALVFLHARGVDTGMLMGGLFFEDLILLSEDGGFRVKIVPTLLHGGSLEHAFDSSKTPQCVAPEVLNTDEDWSAPSDIWSVGVISFALLFGCRPFRAPNPSEELQCLLAGRYTFPTESRHISARAKDFIARSLSVDKDRRPTAVQLLQHPWMQPRLCDEDTAIFVLACHPRIGEASPASNLPSEIFRRILFLSLNKEDLYFE